MPNCAFLSISNTEGWFIDDDLVHPYLENLGWNVSNIPWNTKTDWNQYDIVVIRSPWDYQNHIEEFIRVLKDIETSSAMLLNSLKTVLWNIDKKYLTVLKNNGAEGIPAFSIKNLKKTDVINAYKTWNTDEIIIKPMVGANADDTFRIQINNTSKIEEAINVFSDRACIIQPFMKNIVEEGEFSLMFFNGQLSHTILKTTAAGDFRVQEEHGGGVIPIKEPEKQLVGAAKKAMKALPVKPFYARVDMVRTHNNSFALMELELIEPCLYFRFDEKAPENFARSIHNYYQKHLEK